MKSEPTRKMIWLILIAVIIVAAFLMFNKNSEEVIVEDNSDETDITQVENTEPVVESEPEPDPVEIDYRIVEERDISYLNCKRLAVSTVVPDDAVERDVEHTLYLLARDYLIDWDDVTVWAWGYSEEAQIGTIPATKGTVEESLPGLCS